MGAHDQIMQALADGLPVTPGLLTAGYSGVLAVDSWNGWGAGYYPRITAGGQWSSDVYLSQSHGFEWLPIGDGGVHGEGWPTEGWRPVVEEVGLMLGPAHHVAAVDAVDDDLLVRAQVGYAGSLVSAVRVDVAGATRIVEVGERLRAFIVVGPDGVWRLTPLDDERDPIGPTIVIQAGSE